MADTLEQVVIRQRRPLRSIFLLLTGMMIGAACLGGWLYFYQTDMEKRLNTLQTQHQQLLTDNQRLQQQNTQLGTALTSYDQQVATQKVTAEKLEQRLAELQDTVIELNQELAFYQNITQGNSSSELQVRELQLRQDEASPGSYHYRLVITQGENIKEPVQGQITLAIIAGEDKRQIAEHDLHVRYVQVVEGRLSLTADMQPEKLAVRLSQDDKTLTSREFDWQLATPLRP